MDQSKALSNPRSESRRSAGSSIVCAGVAMRMKSIRWTTITKGFLNFALAIAIAQVSCDVVICNYERFILYDSMYHKRTEYFCVFNDVFLGSDMRYVDFMGKSLDYKRIAFINSKFSMIPQSLYRSFDDVRELYVRRCTIEKLKIMRLIEKLYAGGNQITNIIIDGNGSNNLKELYLESNYIADIANITNLPNLQVLVLENNPRMGNVDFAMFSRMVKLWKLDLENTGMTKIINSLKLTLDELKRLDLSNNQLTYIDMQQFRTFPKLEHLWLHGNRLFAMQYDSIRTILPVIKSIVIDDNYWGCNHLANVSKYFLDQGIIIRHKECKSRAVHKVCCADRFDLVDYRYIIEMIIKSETRFSSEIKCLEQENHALRETIDGMQAKLNSLISNYTNTLQELNKIDMPEPSTLEPESTEEYLEESEEAKDSQEIDRTTEEFGEETNFEAPSYRESSYKESSDKKSSYKEPLYGEPSYG